MLIVFNDHAQQGGIEIKTKVRGQFSIKLNSTLLC